ncbi:MAG: hypothetical protein ACREIC_19135 [Limisphaerales bacterium]
MTKLIALVIAVAVLYGGWELFLYWDSVKNDEETQKKQAAASVVIPEQLPGVPYELENALQAATSHGADGLGAYLKQYRSRLQDPRKAWLQMDYCQMLAREDTADAKRLFAEIKARTPTNSPVWPRVKQLEKIFQ